MKKNNIHIKSFSYSDKKELLRLIPCFSNWFNDPKSLHLTNSKAKFPFNIKNWISTEYRDINTEVLLCLKNDWIIGHVGYKINLDDYNARIFHLIIDPNERKKKHGHDMIRFVEDLVQKKCIKNVTTTLLKRNQPAVDLFISRGFIKIKDINGKYAKFRKTF